MKLIVSKEDIKKVIEKAGKAVDSRAPIPAMQNIYIGADESGTVTVMGGNSSVTVKQEIQANVQEAGSVAVSPRTGEVIKAIASDEITMSAGSEEGYCTVEAGDQSFSIPFIPGSDYPRMPGKEGNEFAIDGAGLAEGIRKTIFAASSDEIRPVLTAVNISSSGGTIVFLATDSFRIARTVIKAPAGTPDFSVNVPAASLKLLLPYIAEDGYISICIAGKRAFFTTGGVEIMTRLIDSAYPDIQRIIDETVSPAATIRIDRKHLADIIDHVSIVTDSSNVVKLSMADLTISARSKEFGSADEKFQPAEKTGSDITICFCAKYLKQALKTFDDEEVVIKLAGALRPFRVSGTEGPRGKNIQIVVPVRAF